MVCLKDGVLRGMDERDVVFRHEDFSRPTHYKYAWPSELKPFWAQFFTLLLLLFASWGWLHRMLQSSSPLAIVAPQLLSLQSLAVLLWVSAWNFSVWFLRVGLLFPLSLCHCLCNSLCAASHSAVKGLKKLLLRSFSKKNLLGGFSAMHSTESLTWGSLDFSPCLFYVRDCSNKFTTAEWSHLVQIELSCVLCSSGLPTPKLSSLLWCHQHLFFTLTSFSLTYVLSPTYWTWILMSCFQTTHGKQEQDSLHLQTCELCSD